MLLVVDDDSSVVEFVKLVGDDYFSHIDNASDLKEARKLLGKKRAYRLAIIDLYLKEGSGLDVIRELQSHEHEPYKSLPIVVTSALFDDEFKEKHQGKFALLEKPFQLGELKKVFEEHALPAPKKKEAKAGKDAEKTEFLKKLTKG